MFRVPVRRKCWNPTNIPFEENILSIILTSHKIDLAMNINRDKISNNSSELSEASMKKKIIQIFFYKTIYKNVNYFILTRVQKNLMLNKFVYQ